jgi:RNA polymerase sigma-70 factor (ECF subfamily)
VLDASALYSSHLDRVYAFFAYRVSDPVEAEDLTSLTFERVVRHAGRFDASKGSATTWLFAIAERQLIDHYRRQGRRDETTLEGVGHVLVGPDDRPSIGLTPALQRAIEGLSERERQVVGLRFGADLSGREIAKIVDATEDNVHQILSRALRRMRTELGDVSQAR